MLAITVNAKTIYVSQTGNDLTGDGTKLKPYATICMADTMVMADNDTVKLAAGTYTASVKSIIKPFNQVICGESATSTIIDFTGLDIGIFVDQYQITLKLKDLTLQGSGNNSLNGGGLLWMHASTSLIMENVIVNNNFANNMGGAICFYGQSIIINNCYFENNYIHSPGAGSFAYGGAIFIQGFNGTVNASITNTTFYNNSSDYFGGAITFWKTTGSVDNVLISNCTFLENKSLDAADNWLGGAINFQSVSSSYIYATLVNNTFYNNTSWNGNGVTTILAQGSQTHLTLVNNLITNSTGDGVTFYDLDGSSAFIKGNNNIIRSIGPELITTDFYTVASNNNSLDPTSPNVTGVKLDGTLTDKSTETQFKVPYLEIFVGSTTIDKGINSYGTPNIVPQTDVTGRDIINSKKDIGSFEYSVATALEKNSIVPLKIYAFGKQVYVTLADETNAQIAIFNDEGACESIIRANQRQNIINISKSGIYLVRIEDNGKTYCQKVLIK
jgi:hypothetical protein